MFVSKKDDPLVSIATSVMKEGDLRRDAEKLTNETLGVFSRRQLPHERHAEYDALLVQNVDEALGKEKTLTEENPLKKKINEAHDNYDDVGNDWELYSSIKGHKVVNHRLNQAWKKAQNMSGDKAIAHMTKALEDPAHRKFGSNDTEPRAILRHKIRKHFGDNFADKL